MRNDSCYEAWLTVESHQTRDTTQYSHFILTRCQMLFSYKSQKIDSISFRHFLSSVLPYIRIREQICPAPSVLTHSMHPIANPSHALSTLVPRVPAEPAMKLSSVATASPGPSVYFVILPSHILRFSVSVLPRPFSLAISPSTSRTFSSHKNRPCFPPHRLLSRMTGSLPTSMRK